MSHFWIGGGGSPEVRIIRATKGKGRKHLGSWQCHRRTDGRRRRRADGRTDKWMNECIIYGWIWMKYMDRGIGRYGSLGTHSYRGHTKNISSSSHQKHQPYVFSENTEISVGWSYWSGWKQGVSLASNSSSQLKSQPCISREYVGLMFLAGPLGVALVSALDFDNQREESGW